MITEKDFRMQKRNAYFILLLSLAFKHQENKLLLVKLHYLIDFAQGVSKP